MAQMKKHKYGHWRYMLQHGKERKKLEFPSRERMLVRDALSRIGLRYKETVAFLNPHYRGWKGEVDAALQWIDFTVWTGKKMIALLFYPRNKRGGLHKHQKTSWAAKQRFLTEHGIPFVVLDRSETSQLYEHHIRNLLRKEK